MKKFFKTVVASMSIIMLLGGSALAGAKNDYKKYGKFTIRCYLNCTSQYAEAKTSDGNMDGYKNYCKVYSYNKNGNAITHKQGYAKTNKNYKITKGKPYSAKSYHAVANNDNIQVYPTYMQQTWTCTRY